MVDNITILDGANGEQTIPFMQVILMLTSDLDGDQECDQAVMQKLLTALIDRLEITPNSQASPDLITRSPKTEGKYPKYGIVDISICFFFSNTIFSFQLNWSSFDYCAF